MYLSDNPSFIQLQSAIRNATRIDQSPDDGYVLRNGLPMKVAGVLPAESGTWTPVPYGYTAAGTPACAAQGTYARVGKLVFLTFGLTFTDLGGMAGNFMVTGIPFPVDRINGGALFYGAMEYRYVSGSGVIVPRIDAGPAVSFYVSNVNNVGSQLLTAGWLNSNSVLNGSIAYFTN